MIKNMDLGNLFGQMGGNIKVNGKMVNSMEGECLLIFINKKK